jgi:hypothetical protein
MDDERPKRSWREIDRMREHKSDRSTSSKAPARLRNQKSYRAALDRLFDSGKIGALVKASEPPVDSAADAPRLKLLKAVKEAEGRDAITVAVDAYLETHSLPEDFEVLTKVLEHRDKRRQREALTSLMALADQQKPRRAGGLLGQLRLLRDISDEPDIVELATSLIDRLE